MRGFQLLFFSLFYICSSFLNAHTYTERTKRNTVSLNVGGGGALYGFNYDRSISLSSNVFLSPIAGLGFTEIQSGFFSNGQGDNLLVIPHSLNIYFGKRDVKPEIGFGGTYAFHERVEPYLFYPNLGLRWHPKKSEQFQLRLFGNLILNDNFNDYQWLSGKGGHYHFSIIGLNIGVRF